jgi:hypothetical protein
VVDKNKHLPGGWWLVAGGWWLDFATLHAAPPAEAPGAAGAVLKPHRPPGERKAPSTEHRAPRGTERRSAPGAWLVVDKNKHKKIIR